MNLTGFTCAELIELNFFNGSHGREKVFGAVLVSAIEQFTDAHSRSQTQPVSQPARSSSTVGCVLFFRKTFNLILFFFLGRLFLRRIIPRRPLTTGFHV